jgi:UDP-N-acetylmuramoyl-L-alanyl-D-glutamate--2,6-diaminopimelate ligase
VDYAHTPDALQNVIDTINEIRTPEQKLYVVVGCGGNRDAAKRPVMAKIAAEGGTLAILTSDNPRREDPEAILADMLAGLDPTHKYLKITDRREAIRTAVTLATPGDIILVAGKGHENYQEVNGVKHHFDDKEQVLEFFNL